MRRPLTVLAATALLALAAGGCGSDDSSTTEATAGSAATGTAGDDSQQSSSGQKGKDEGKKGSGDGRSASSDSGGSDDLPPAKIRPEEFKPVPGGDNSIQEFGDEAGDDEEEEIVEAMFAFFRAMANQDYAAVCDGITEANRKGLEQFLKLKKKEGTCETVLGEILVRGASEAERAAAGAVYQVRVEDENAFVLFTPAGGKASYFVMTRENGEWKSTSISTGTPFDPLG